MGTQPPPKERGTNPQISAHVYCDHAAGFIRISLGTEVGLSVGDIVLDGDPAPPPLKGHSPPIFGSCPLWPNGWMDQDATGHGGRPGPRRRCVRWEPSYPRKWAQHPLFSAAVYCGHGRLSQLLLSSCALLGLEMVADGDSNH